MITSTEAFLAGMLAGYGIAIPVGAIAILIMSLAARTSLHVGAAAALGVATADGLYAVLAVAGGAALAGVIEPLADPLRWLAVLVLLLLAAWTAGTAWRRHRNPASTTPRSDRPASPARAYLALTALTLLNPMTIVYFAALVLGRQAAGGLGPAGAALFALGAFLASASWQLLIAGGGRLVGRMLAGPRGRLGTALASSALIAILAVNLLNS